METSRQQLQAYRANQGPTRPVLEEFIPLKTTTSDQNQDNTTDNISHDKANWMTTAQLWSQDSNIETKPQTTTIPTLITYPKLLQTENIGFNVSTNSKLALDTKQRNGGGGAFLPFTKDRNMCPPSPTLALASADNKDMELLDKKCSETDQNGFSCPKRESSVSKVGNGGAGGNNNSSSDGQGTNSATPGATASCNTTQTHRKARRCWSPDLHRRFVNALQMLGGSQGNKSKKKKNSLLLLACLELYLFMMDEAVCKDQEV